jgi:DNA modification methylase
VTCTRKIGPYPCCSVVEGDCLELMKALPDGCVDAVITDPPYGIGESNEKNLSRGKKATPKDYGHYEWDNEPASPEAISELRRVSRLQVVFGGNYFELPPSSCWLVWDKQNGANDFADCELAWTNLDKAVRRIYWMWNGMIRRGNEERFHPTQKPLGVMKWCIEQAGFPETILDPYAGSGTTGAAAKELGIHYLLFEREPRNVEISRKRIALVEAQPNLFQPKAEQLSLEAK